MALNYTEGRQAAEFLLSEAQGGRSREQITIASGQGVLQPGTVLGMITASGLYVASPATGADGSQVGQAVLLQRVDATSAAQVAAAIVRDAEVKTVALVYHSTVNTGPLQLAKRQQMAAATGANGRIISRA